MIKTQNRIISMSKTLTLKLLPKLRNCKTAEKKNQIFWSKSFNLLTLKSIK